MDQREEWNRAKWASRRGLLELDLLLAPFVTEAFLGLNSLLRKDYRELLFQDDQDLMERLQDVRWPARSVVVPAGVCDSVGHHH